MQDSALPDICSKFMPFPGHLFSVTCCYELLLFCVPFCHITILLSLLVDVNHTNMYSVSQKSHLTFSDSFSQTDGNF